MNVHEWIQMGFDNGWCTPSHCLMHDGYALTEKESEDFDQGLDPCVHVLRLCWDKEEQEAILGKNEWLTR